MKLLLRISPIVYLSLFLCLSSAVRAGGPWTPPKGSGILILNFTPIVYNQISGLTAGNSISLNRWVYDVNLQLYGEYGLTDRLALIGNLPLKYVRSGTEIREQGDFPNSLPAGSMFGLGNTELSLKYAVLTGSLPLAVSMKVEAPGTGNDLATGLRTGLPVWSFVPTVHIGKSISPRVYIQGDVGISFRAKDYSDELRASIEAGFKLKKPIWLALLIQSKESFQNRQLYDPNSFQTGLYPNDQSWEVFCFKFDYCPDEKWGFNSSLGGQFRSRFGAATPSISLGVYRKL